MSTKFDRPRCLCCTQRLVVWKMYPIVRVKGDPLWLCWDCANTVYQRWGELNIQDQPSKEFRIAESKRVRELQKLKKSLGSDF